MVFVEFHSKFTKFGEIHGFPESHAYQAFSTGFPMPSMGEGGCVDIFWNSPIIAIAVNSPYLHYFVLNRK